ncbi:MAG: response regulator [Gammaproteobacteria bacterium]|jgi:signal transduction histidine kinase|nr:response regulator [Gammaproteobacteria bacterium]
MPERILALTPTRDDAALCRRFLDDAGFRNEICEDAATLCAALARPAAVLVVAEESLHGTAGDCIREHLAQQPAWSAIPVIVLAGKQSRHRLGVLEDYDAYGRVTLLERPVRMASFIGTLRLALRERRQQYRIRDLLSERAEAIKQRDEFLAMLGHELRNPLAAVLISTEVLETVPPDSERAAYCRNVLGTQARQMKRLLDDLSDMSRINRRKLSLERERVDLRRVLLDAVDQVDDKLKARDQCLDLELDPEGPTLPLLADPMRLRQVFANLLTNANRYTPEGGHIWLRLDTGDGLARVSVRDDGAGMSEEALAHIFEPFYQDRSEGRPQAGLGIGLTLATSLVKMHAGTITAHSAGPGCGSELIVTLPLAEADTGQAAAAAQPVREPATGPATAGLAGPDSDAAPDADAGETRQPAARGGESRHILLIEDNQDFAVGLQQLLEARGNRVSVVHDGTDGLRKAQDDPPQVVLLDIGLPGVDGYEVARRLRRIAGLSQVRVIAVTGFGRAADRERSRQAGIDRHLVKPVAMADLESAMA